MLRTTALVTKWCSWVGLSVDCCVVVKLVSLTFESIEFEVVLDRAITRLRCGENSTDGWPCAKARALLTRHWVWYV